MRRVSIVLLFAAVGLAGVAGEAFADLASVMNPIRVCIQNVNGTTTCTFTKASASGDVVHLFIHGETAGMTTPTDNLSTTYTLEKSVTTGGADAWEYCGILSSSGVITITLNGSTSWQGTYALEFPNTLGYGCTLDLTTGGTPSSDPFTSTLTTATDGELVFCYSTSFHSGTNRYYDGTGVIGFIGETGGDAAGLGYFYSGTNGSQSCTAHNDLDGNSRYIMSAYKVSSIKIATPDLPNAIQSTAYSYTLRAIGGVGAYTWSLSSGSLPSGITLNSSTGALSASNVTGGTATVTFQVTDGTNTATKSLTLNVNSSAATPTFVSNSGIQTPTGGNLTVSVGSISSGTQLLVEEYIITRTNFEAPTDTCATQFYYLGGRQNSLSSGEFIAFWAGVTTAGCTDTITGYGAQGLGVINISGVQPFYDVIGGADGNCTSGVAFNGPTLTTLSANSFGWVAGITDNGSITYSTSFSGFSIDVGQSGSFPNYAMHGTEASTGTYTPTMTPSGTTKCTLFGAFLRQGGSGVASSGTIKFKSTLF